MPRDSSWSTPVFTARRRGCDPGVPPFERWEDVLVHETSSAYRLLMLLTRVPGVRRLIGPVEPVRHGASLAEREAAVARLRSTRGYRLLERLRGRQLTPPADGPAPDLGPLTSARVDDAIELLRTIPFEEIQRRGWHFQPNDFMWPLNDVDFLDANWDLWHGRGLPKGVRWDIDGQLELARELDAYRGELADVPRLPQPGLAEFAWENWTFEGADAIVYYGLLRAREPGRVIEIGSGWSSLLLARALERNERDCEVTIVEPDLSRVDFSALPSGSTVRQSLLQHVELGIFEELEAGDVCFFDGSHCVRTGGDVNWFVFEVLPRLRPGVRIHIHDIFFPEDYVDRWILDEGLSWNEQYLVQAFLMHNDAYEVLISNHLLYTERRAEIDRLHGEDGGSLWLTKVGPAEA